MKKAILMIFAVACMANMSSAQSDDDKVRFGVKGGLNYSNVYDEEGEQFEADAKSGFVGGAFLSIPLGKYLGVQPEVLFSQKGFQATGVILGSTYKFTRTTNHIDVPILFAFKPAKFFTLLAGPQYSYLLKQKDVFVNGTTTVEQETEFKNDNIRRNMLGFLGGVDINIDHLVIGARVGWDIVKNNGDGTTTTPRYKNMWYQATVGYRF